MTIWDKVPAKAEISVYTDERRVCNQTTVCIEFTVQDFPAFYGGIDTDTVTYFLYCALH